MEKSDSLGTKSRRKPLWDYLGGRRSKQTRRNLVRNVIAWIGFNRTTDSNKIEVIVKRIEKNSNDGSGCLFVRLYDIVNIGANADMTK